MPTLLLRMSGPMQSWGDDSKFEIRQTNLYPTKSGVIGMLSAALGRTRDADISDLASLKVGVRVDQPGELIKDFHTAHAKKSSYITTRYYLSDACFVVGLESDDRNKLETLASALKSPVYSLYLGRRSCPPDMPLVLGIAEQTLEQALTSYEWQGRTVKENQKKCRLILENRSESGQDVARRLHDQPVSFDIRNRKYTPRIVYEKMIDVPLDSEKDKAGAAIYHTTHDPMGALEDI